VSLIVVLQLNACSSLTKKPQKPSVELVQVKPLNISMAEQKLRFVLKVTNPNSFDMPVETIDFIARFNDTQIASGKSNQSVTIKANSDALLSLDVTAGLNRLVSTLQTLIEGESLNLDYELSGKVEVANWPTPIPFDVIGAMDLENQ